MKIIIDTNVWISFLLGKRLSSLKEIFAKEEIEIYVSDILLKEIFDVANRRKFQGKINPDSLLLLFELIRQRCISVSTGEISETYDRDPKDTFLLQMAHEIKADYLITGDLDLLVLKNFEGTSILTFSEFLQNL